VISDEQILVCPECQQKHDWVGDLDRCASCGSTMLLRALGETRCRQCSWTKAAAPAGGLTKGTLAEDVEAALRRRFER
jgi:DNA-directed RNA polymerase subunit RPC12/RpoP